MNLVAVTKDLLAERQYKVRHMCDSVGVTESWFYRWRREGYGNAGVETVQAIHDYLIDCPLKAPRQETA